MTQPRQLLTATTNNSKRDKEWSRLLKERISWGLVASHQEDIRLWSRVLAGGPGFASMILNELDKRRNELERDSSSKALNKNYRTMEPDTTFEVQGEEDVSSRGWTLDIRPVMAGEGIQYLHHIQRTVIRENGEYYCLKFDPKEHSLREEGDTEDDFRHGMPAIVAENYVPDSTKGKLFAQNTSEDSRITIEKIRSGVVRPIGGAIIAAENSLHFMQYHGLSS